MQQGAIATPEFSFWGEHGRTHRTPLSCAQPLRLADFQILKESGTRTGTVATQTAL